MIPFDFEYYRPGTIKEAVDTFQSLKKNGRDPLYYGGGTEIISMARANSIRTGAVVDIKEIPECNKLGFEEKELVIGGAVTLTQIAESNVWPLLGLTVARIADHTIQGKITLGGNIAGTIEYKEASLPLLLSDSTIVFYGPSGKREVLFSQAFDRRVKLNEGEFIGQFKIGSDNLGLPFFHRKTTKIDKIDYPLVTLAALKKDEKILVAFSGLCSYPFRSQKIEECLNKPGISREERIENALSYIPSAIKEDIHGSANYRRFVLTNTLMDALEM